MKPLARMSLLELAQYVARLLADNGIDAVLVGGACVSVYSKNRYQSYDLDFVTETSLKELRKVLSGAGFTEKAGRLFVNPDTEYLLDFVAPPVCIGTEPTKEFSSVGALKMLSPADCVKDRLCAYYHWSDVQSLDQAVMVAKAQKKHIVLKEIERWSKKEGFAGKYADFAARV